MIGVAINPRTGLVNLTEADVREAEHRCRLQMQHNAKLIRMSKSTAGNPADVALCERVVTAGKGDFAEFENLLTFPEVRALFNRGALFFRPARR